ncbi:MAG: type II toxin-antitoxin system VapC family toxin [Treponema sp.]|nr:type II toxin-antitoxin system VapC family toxin [Treponema sp.]
MVYADANILIRFIINDDEAMAGRAAAAIDSGSLFVLPEVIAETVYVLTKVYGIDRADVADTMLELLTSVSTIAPAVMHNALAYYKESTLDFVDCILASHRLTDGKMVFTFDKKLNNFIARKEAAGES